MIIFAFIFQSLSAYAFSNNFEYHSLSERETLTFDDPSDIDGEYESDVLTFTPGFEERWLFLASPRAFSGSFGSLDSNHFFTRQNLKLNFSIGESTEFHVLNFRERDFELDAADTIFEIQHALTPSHAVALYGSASFDKKEDDIGLAYLWRRQTPEKTRSARLYISASDFSRNERNDLDDEFTKAPIVAGLTLNQMSTNGTFKELALRAEPDMEWEFPTAGRVYSYSRYFAYAAARRKTADGFFSWRGEYDVKKERQSPDSYRTQRGRIQIENELREQREHPWSYGLWISLGDWDKNETSKAKAFIQPYFWYELKRYEKYGWDGGAGLVTTNEGETDSRLNIALKSLHRKDLILKALFTFDGDRFLKSDFWEGGNIQLATAF